MAAKKKTATKKGSTTKARETKPGTTTGLAMALLSALSMYRRKHLPMSDKDVDEAVGKLKHLVADARRRSEQN